ncbi:GDYXXLXY domain-containing protein [Leptolyngbya sp. FACHB-261]|uniref:GDYXXLXY domain-containing protein n=1 Tax=Leptolyngbya sp. FACHB-261 TaxID=2692806 RepID=UPI00168579B5|nr:GDYXXLXY domain-containing protein [Leptolyngbya sp. FACHB-261]MBD2101540.1 GDYXXLXY domain-containing protein [Leptolyngbya sp. FACHB-261]
MTATTGRPLPGWRLWLPLAFQIVLVAAVPAQAIYTQLLGRAVILQTVPVDPYSLMQGYSVTLSYDISNLDTLKRLPGWQDIPKTANAMTSRGSPERVPGPETTFYIILEAPPQTGTRTPPQAWKPVAIRSEQPKSLAANQVALKGQGNHWNVLYGLETYYIPEEVRFELNEALRLGSKQAPVVEIKVDKQGHAVPVRLWVKNREYRF